MGYADAGRWIERLEPDWENYRAALQHLAGRDPVLALDLAGRSWFAAYRTGRVRESLERLLALLAQPENAAPTPARGLALHAAATFSWSTGAVATAAELFDQALAIRREIGDAVPLAATLNNRGILAREQGEYDRAAALHSEALELRREIGLPAGIATSLANLALLASDRGDLPAAREYGTEALDFFRSLGDDRNAGTTLLNLGRNAMFEGQVDEAAAHFAQALSMQQAVGDPRAIALAHLAAASAGCVRDDLPGAGDHADEALWLARETGDAWLEAYALGSLGWVAERAEEWERARELLQDSLRRRVALGDVSGQGEVIQHLAITFAGLGEAVRAARLFGAERAVQRETGYQRFPIEAARADGVQVELAVALGAEGLIGELEAGEALTLPQAVSLALR